MQAVVCFEPGGAELREMAQPAPGPGQVLVRVEAVGVCGSDVHMWKGPVSWEVRYPVVLGHEFAGRVAQAGPGVRGFQPGDRVTCETAAEVCGACAFCRCGEYNLCPERKGFGALVDGAMAEFIAVRQEIVHRLPNALSFEDAALTEPAAVAFNAVFVKSRPLPGDRVVIIGPGPIGLMALQMVKLASPARVVVVGLGRDEHRLELARRLGADRVVIADREDLVEVVRTLGDGLGADLVVDAVGVRETVAQSLQIVRPNGQIVKIGWDRNSPDASLDPLVAKAATLRGSFSHTWPTWERVLSLAAMGRIDLGCIGESFPLSDWERAFAWMDSLKIAKAILVS